MFWRFSPKRCRIGLACRVCVTLTELFASSKEFLAETIALRQEGSMNAYPTHPGVASIVEAARAPAIEAAVHRLAMQADRARASGKQDEADRLLLDAWAAFDA